MSEVSAAKKHNIILEERSKLSISGVTDVESFDENEISLYTTLGELSVKGKCPHVDEMSLESGNITISGDVKSLVYGDKDRTKKPSLWGKITR